MLAYLSGQSVNLLLLVIAIFTFGLKTFALVDAALRPKQAYAAAGKLDKLKWVAIVGVAFVINLVVLNPLNLLNVIGDVAAIVYLVDVRPALRGLGPAGAIFKRKGGGPQSGGWGGGATGW